MAKVKTNAKNDPVVKTNYSASTIQLYHWNVYKHIQLCLQECNQSQ